MYDSIATLRPSCLPQATSMLPTHNLTDRSCAKHYEQPDLPSMVSPPRLLQKALLFQETGCWTGSACPSKKKTQKNYTPHHKKLLSIQVSAGFSWPGKIKSVFLMGGLHSVANGLSCSYNRRSVVGAATAGHSSPARSKAPTKEQAISFHIREELKAFKAIRYNYT